MTEIMMTLERGRGKRRSAASGPKAGRDHSSCIAGAQLQSARTPAGAFERKE